MSRGEAGIGAQSSPTIGARAVGYQDAQPGSVPHDLDLLLDHQDFISAFRFLTEAEILDVASYTGALDVTAAVQAALDGAWRSNRNLHLPAGLYRVSTLDLPGGQADRSRAFRVHGQGAGELFARAMKGGTILASSTDRPILVAKQDRANAGTGNQQVAYLRFEGDSSGPVVDFETLYAQSEFHHCGVYQRGTGDGLRIRHANTVDVHHNYVMNDQWNAAPSRRTGIGIHVTVTNDNALLMLRKNTVRGFGWGYKLGNGGGSGILYSPRIEHCEASVINNGIWLTSGVRGAAVESCYLEGGDGGTGILDQGNYNSVSNCVVFPGFTVGIDSSANNIGSHYTGNMLAAGSVAGTTLMTINSSGSQGGLAKAVIGNSFVFNGSGRSIPGVVGLRMTGMEPRLTITGNAFDPRGQWIGGRETQKLDDRTSHGGIAGFTTVATGEYELPLVSRGAISLMRLALGDAAVHDTRLVVPDGSWFELDLSETTRISQIDGGGLDGRVLILHDLRGRLVIAPGPSIRLAQGREFNGPGMLTLMLRREGEASIAFEVSRTAF